MKKHLIILCTVFIATALTAGTGPSSASQKIVTGKVIDKMSGEEIAGAAVVIGSNTVYTDLNGNFSTCILLVKAEATVKFVSYNETRITIDPLSYETLVIELSSK